MDPLHGSRVVRPLGNAGSVLGLKLFLTLWLIVSIVAANVAFAPHPLPTKDILILNINGQIDDTLVSNFRNAFIGIPSPDYLIIQMNSSGGYYDDVLVLGREINTMKVLVTKVYFIAGGDVETNRVCTSGCYILSTFAYQTLLPSDTSYGFGHNINEVGNILSGLEAILYLNQGMTERDFRMTMNQSTFYHNDDLKYQTTLDSLLYVIQSKIQASGFQLGKIETVEIQANAKL